MAGHVCGHLLDDKMNHSLICNRGGGPVARHDAVARTLATLITSKTGIPTRLEQWIPTMQRTLANGRREQARFDVVLTWDGQPAHIDVAIVTPYSTKPEDLVAAANKPGHMAKKEERNTFCRYQGHKLILFVLETTGRPGEQAKKFIHNLFRYTPNAAQQVKDTWACIQATLHTHISLTQLKTVKSC